MFVDRRIRFKRMLNKYKARFKNRCCFEWTLLNPIKRNYLLRTVHIILGLE